MRISFVIPAHNEEAYLGRCLRSVLGGIEKGPYDAEVIVVDNASTDRTGQVAGSFAGVKVVSEPRKGLPSARQAGYLAATGDLIANIDADTVLPPGWLDKVLLAFDKDPGLVALSGPFIYYDLSLLKNIFIRIFYFGGFALYLLNRFVLRIGSLLQGGNFIIRKSALDRIHGFNLDYSFYGEDTEIAKRLFKVGKVKFTFALPIYTSGRRLIEEGIIASASRYVVNHIWPIFFKKPFSGSYVYVRPGAGKESDLKERVNLYRPRIVSVAALFLSVLIFGSIGAVAYISFSERSRFSDEFRYAKDKTEYFVSGIMSVVSEAVER